ncbi:UDP-N-acetylmuramate dehydrogenase [Desulfocicer vacuolatum]|nr:UDP-N-acetylmuramate dehydrogenase [Desulfocicer vacuolatum]
MHKKNLMPLTLETFEKLGIKQKEPMKKHTSFKVGGPADLFARPHSIETLEKLLKMAKFHDLPLTVMGSGTNLLVRDRGIRGLVISMDKLKYPIIITPLQQEIYRIQVSAGTILAGLYRETMAQGIGGLGFAAGIPGSVGGAVMMNAGTGEGTMADVVASIDIMDTQKGVITLPRSDLRFSHRCLSFNENVPRQQRPILVGATLIMARQDKKEIKAQWQTLLEKRKKCQPVQGAGAGCFFKNPPRGKSAGELIDRAGLKGFKVGNAMVSSKHANFILNMGQATAEDIIKLKHLIEKKVNTQFGIRLENEVKIEGE